MSRRRTVASTEARDEAMRRTHDGLLPLARRFGLSLIVQFGSTATGRASSESDFDVALRCGVLSPAVVAPFKASYVGLRNRIVHDYDRLDELLVARAAAKLVADPRAYARAVQSFLVSKAATPRDGEVRERRVPYQRVAKKVAKH